MSNSIETVSYGIGSIKGYVVNDDIALSDSADSAAKGVNFLSIYYADMLHGIESDGLLGLSPNEEAISDESGE